MTTAATPMLTKYITISHIVFALALIFIVVEWSSARKELKTAEASIVSTEAARKTETAQLNSQLEQIEHDKAAIKTPAQAVQAINKYIPLPTPISSSQILSPVGELPAGNARTVDTSLRPGVAAGGDSGGNNQVDAGATIPTVDLKPLANYAASCTECNVKLAYDEKQIKQLTSERDTALKAAKGGGFWRRAGTIVKWAAIGAAVGYVAAKR